MPTVFGQYGRCVVEQSHTSWDGLVNVFGFVLPTATTFDLAAASAIESAVEGVYSTHAGLFVDRWAIEGITVKGFRSSLDPTFEFGSTVVGTELGHAMPPDTAAVLSWATGLGGRANRGRTYIGGPAETFNDDDGRINTVIQGDYTQFGVDLIADLNTAGFPLAVVSTVFEGAPRAAALVTAVATVSVDRVWDRQRRRAK